MKKDLLFVINNLNCGGAEKALISLLETIDYTVYNVDLLLFKHEGLFFKQIPKQVNLLNEPLEFNYFDMPIKTAIIDSIKKGRLDITASRIGAGFIFKTEKNIARCEQRVWKYISKSLKQLDKEYDVAIGYLEKNPIYFCLDKVKAPKKFGFIHTDYKRLGMDPKIDKLYFNKLDNIITVSNDCVNNLKMIFPEFADKIKLIKNIVSPRLIQQMSLEEVKLNPKSICIVSVGRLHYVKGFHLAIEACELLIQNGYDIKWYVIGEGGEKEKLEDLLKTKKLENVFRLVGLKENPYPYIRQCDIYVQSSLFEGQCLTITEAKILNKPIVTTNFSAIFEQIENEKNGLIVNQDPREIFNGIKRLVDNQDLRKSLIQNLSQEQHGTESEINKLYALIGAV